MIHPLLAHPLQAVIAFVGAGGLTLFSFFAHRYQKRMVQQRQRAHDEALLDIARGVRHTLEKLDISSSSLSPSSGTLSDVWQMPYHRNPFFTGREQLLQALYERFTRTQTTARMTTQALCGLGGIGKTQTAIEYAYRYREAYHFVLWIRAASRDTIIADFILIADLLHLPQKDDQDQKRVVAAVKNWLADHSDWLLILDNADDVELAREFLPTKNTGHILLTTRAQAPGVVAEPITVETMNQEEGTLLLLRRVRLLAPNTPIDHASEADSVIAREIVRTMDGLPLALDQAGAYIERTGCGLAGYLKLYQHHRTDLLHWRSPLSSEYPYTVATTWSLSFQHMEQANPAAADLLRLCAFLDPDAIPEELIAKGAKYLGPVLQPVASNDFKLNETIEVLRTFSLIRRIPDTQSLAIHRLVQVVLKDQMDSQTQQQWAERTVCTVSTVFPGERWLPFRHLLPHALTCTALIDQYHLHFVEAAHLLDRTATYLQDHGQYTQAEPLLQRALAIYEKNLGPDHPDIATTLNHLARIYQDQGRYRDAEPLLRRALAIDEAMSNSDHLSTATTLHNLAWLYLLQYRYRDAEPLLQRALAIREPTLGPNHPDTAASIDNLAWLYALQGRYRDAEPLYQRALAMYEQTLGPDHPDTAAILLNLARLYLVQGHYDNAAPFLQRALVINEQMLIPNHPYTATTLHNLARLYQDQGRYAAAEPLYHRALTIREKVRPEHPDTATTLENYANLLRKMKREQEAEAYERQAKIIRAEVVS